MTKKNVKNVRSAGRVIHGQHAPVEANTWSVTQAAAWAGIPTRTLYQMLRASIGVPCISLGERQEQQWPKAHDGKRRRACFRYMIPRVAFIKYWENISRPESTASSSAA
jgi:hypothetical protein